MAHRPHKRAPGHEQQRKVGQPLLLKCVALKLHTAGNAVCLRTARWPCFVTLSTGSDVDSRTGDLFSACALSPQLPHAPPRRGFTARPLDLIFRWGAWSAPLLGAALLLTQTRAAAWIVAFYLLPLAFNYPLFMATAYRADHIRADFEKYKIFIRTSPCC